MARRRHPKRGRTVTSFVRIPAELPPGKVRCAACWAVCTVTPTGKLRAHKSPAGEPCAHRATYATRAPLDSLPPVVLPPVRTDPRPREPKTPPKPRVAPPREPSRLDVGSSCTDCGRWLPGERSLCGRCANHRKAAK